jgi:hypothetical protein
LTTWRVAGSEDVEKARQRRSRGAQTLNVLKQYAFGLSLAAALLTVFLNILINATSYQLEPIQSRCFLYLARTKEEKQI